MDEGTRTATRKDWTHEGCGRSVLAAGDFGKQSQTGAGQRDRKVTARGDEGKF